MMALGMLIVQLLASGLQTGAIYALTAAGFALIFGATGLFHVAHASAFLIAGYAFILSMNAGIGWVLSSLAALVCAVAFGIGSLQLIYRPIQRSRASFFTIFVAAFGISIVVQSLVEFFIGRDYVALSTPLSRSTELAPGLYIAPVFWVSVGTALVVFAVVGVFLAKSRFGIGLRALSHSSELVRAFGLSSFKLSVAAFGIGSALVVPPAILTVMTTGIYPAAGGHLMLVSLAATIVGGVGSFYGAALAGLLIGLLENVVILFLDTQWAEGATFVLLFLIIILRPAGLIAKTAVRSA